VIKVFILFFFINVPYPLQWRTEEREEREREKLSWGRNQEGKRERERERDTWLPASFSDTSISAIVWIERLGMLDTVFSPGFFYFLFILFFEKPYFSHTRA
jgi:hypothetical protein